jgi:hypothetical protein
LRHFRLALKALQLEIAGQQKAFNASISVLNVTATANKAAIAAAVASIPTQVRITTPTVSFLLPFLGPVSLLVARWFPFHRLFAVGGWMGV